MLEAGSSQERGRVYSAEVLRSAGSSRGEAATGANFTKLLGGMREGARVPDSVNSSGVRVSERRELNLVKRVRSSDRILYHGEFDPGSERTLAARFKHASRAASILRGA